MIIGIGGASRSGKSTLAHRLKKRNANLSIAIISQDDYAFPEDKIPKINNETNWECPESINFKKLIATLVKTNSSHDVTIVEGLLIYYNEPLSTYFDKKIFIDIEKATFLNRKATDIRWGKTENWYLEHIWESYLQYGFIKPSKELLIVNGNSELNFKKIEEYVGFPKI